MGRSRGFPLTGPMDDKQFHACWDSLPNWRREQLRKASADHNLTLKQVLARWPALRVAKIVR